MPVSSRVRLHRKSAASFATRDLVLEVGSFASQTRPNPEGDQVALHQSRYSQS
jgi:hypothetical protein